MALELEGKIIRKLMVQKGESARGKWTKQEFVIEFQEGNFPSQACFSVWGEDKLKELDKYQLGDKVKVSFNINSREYNNKWYTDLRAWRIEADMPQQEGMQQTPPPMAPTDDIPEPLSEDDLPF